MARRSLVAQVAVQPRLAVCIFEYKTCFLTVPDVSWSKIGLEFRLADLKHRSRPVAVAPVDAICEATWVTLRYSLRRFVPLLTTH